MAKNSKPTRRKETRRRSLGGLLGSPRLVQTHPIYTGMVWVTRQVKLWQHQELASNGGESVAPNHRS